MERRTYTKRSEMSSEQIKERVKTQKRESERRSRIRKKAELLGLPIPPRLYVNEGKTPEEIKQRKTELNKINKQEAKERGKND